MKTPDEIKEALRKCRDDRCVCDMCALSDGNVKKWRELMGYALEYIKSLEESIDPKNRVLTLDEVMHTTEQFVWFDEIEYDNPFKVLVCKNMTMFGSVVFNVPMEDTLFEVPANKYGMRWRCWLQKPTEQERENTPWEKSI